MITAIGDVMRECYKRGWITTRDGNCSVRRKGELKIAITPSAVRKNIIHPESVLRIKIAPGSNSRLILDKSSSPSGELEMHWQLLQNTKKTRCVLHVHSTNIVAAMYAGWDLQVLAEDFPEVFRYTRVGPNVPKLPAISQALADKTSIAFGLKRDGSLEYEVVGQANHGVCAVGKTP